MKGADAARSTCESAHLRCTVVYSISRAYRAHANADHDGILAPLSCGLIRHASFRRESFPEGTLPQLSLIKKIKLGRALPSVFNGVPAQKAMLLTPAGTVMCACGQRPHTLLLLFAGLVSLDADCARGSVRAACPAVRSSSLVPANACSWGASGQGVQGRGS